MSVHIMQSGLIALKTTKREKERVLVLALELLNRMMSLLHRCPHQYYEVRWMKG